MKIIWLSPDGSDVTGNGTKDNPYQTIDYAITLFTDGDQIRLLPGTYNPRDSLVFNNLSGSIFSEEPGKAVIQSVQTISSPAIIYVLNSTRFYIVGVELNQALDPSNNYAGISLNNSNNCHVYKCTVEDFISTADSCYGIHANCVTGSGRIESCIISDINCCGDNVYGIMSGGLDVIDCTVSTISGAGACNSYGIFGGSVYIPPTPPTPPTPPVPPVPPPEAWYVGFGASVPPPYDDYTYYNNPYWSFIRRTDAYQTDSVDYTMTLKGVNVPRIDTTTRGLLIEPESTNILGYSEACNSWTSMRLTSISANATVAPNDTNTMDGLVATAANARHGIKQIGLDITAYVPDAADSPYYGTLSSYAQKGDKDWVWFGMEPEFTNTSDGNEVAGGNRGYYDLNNGTLGAAVDVSTTWSSVLQTGNYIEPAKNRCYRVIYRGHFRRNVTTNGKWLIPRPYLAEANSDSLFAGDAVNINAYYWGMQFELHGYPTSYIATPDNDDVTRSPDIAKFTQVVPPMPTNLGNSNTYKKLKITFDMKCLYDFHRISSPDLMTYADYNDMYYFDLSPGSNTNRIYFKGNSVYNFSGGPVPVENGRLQIGLYDSTGAHHYIISDAPLTNPTRKLVNHGLSNWKSFEFYFDLSDLSNTYALIDGVSDCFGRLSSTPPYLGERVNLIGACDINVGSDALYIGCNSSETGQAGAWIKNMIISWEI